MVPFRFTNDPPHKTPASNKALAALGSPIKRPLSREKGSAYARMSNFFLQGINLLELPLGFQRHYLC